MLLNGIIVLDVNQCMLFGTVRGVSDVNDVMVFVI